MIKDYEMTVPISYDNYVNYKCSSNKRAELRVWHYGHINHRPLVHTISLRDSLASTMDNQHKTTDRL